MDISVNSHLLYACTQTNSRIHCDTHTNQNTKRTPDRERERRGETRGGTHTSPTPIDSKETWTPFLNKTTVHAPGTPSQQKHSTAYPKQQESRRLYISTVRDPSHPFKEKQISPVFDGLSSGQ